MSASERELQALRAIAYFAFLLAACAAVLFFFNVRSRHLYGARSYGFLGWVALYALVVGTGLFTGRRWGLLLLLPAFPLCGVLFPSMAIVRDPSLTTILISILWAGLLSAPSLALWRLWNHPG